MPEDFEEHEHEEKPREAPKQSGTSAWLIVALLVVAAAGSAFAYYQHEQVSQLADRNQQLNADIGRMSQQVDALTAKLTAPPPAPPAATAPASSPAAGAPRKAARRSGADDRRYKQLQARVDEQDKKIRETQEAMDQTRNDFEGRISSTRDELGGSIARTNEELQLMKKRGENDIFDLNLTKSKTFQRVGPISVSLRKADAKHKTYDLAMLVDDNLLTKKKVNLYEPVWIHRSDDAQPVQVVVFRVEKNHIVGYVRAPKYRQSELMSTAAPPPPQPPQ